MMHMGDFITKQCKALLENKQQAIMYAALLSIIPFATWLSVALVCLVTLRKGVRSGFDVLLPALVIHSVPLMMLVPISGALINTLIAYLPCYFAAITLRSTQKWQAVFGVFFIQAVLGCLLLQLLAPEFIVIQFNQLKALLMQYQELVETGMDSISTLSLAQLFFGLQILSAIVSAVVSLMFARSIQAKLFLPGGFKNELLMFRSGRFSLLILLSVSLGTYHEIPLAINVLPIVLSYFLASGFGLAYFILARKSQVKVFLLLMLIILLKPTFALFAYIVFGSLDSIFNFRSYLPERVNESI
ncbi:hypothetical protein J2N86_07715 [Legionella lytica]|uniref:Transmembrane protein n=1 Tax=Legionella lytica TaxID=96232 RepID=A0ABY4Y5A0_9GAMM|nr:hypothetical protein [Legionella lytica]USQ12606.1 hypothetical protein J2N86_07715 [Legionella lytica]